MKNEWSKNTRLQSLDALRGFDMLFIMGFAGLVIAISNLFPENTVSSWFITQMKHAEWHGLTHHDTIFPLFLFVAGISFPFSLAKQKEVGKTTSQIIRKIVKRGLILVVLGFVYNGLFKLEFDSLRYASVLGRIGLAWMFAALLYTYYTPKVLAIVASVLLLGYWLLLALIPETVDPYSFEENLVGVVDRVLLPGKLIYKSFDPEGILSTLPAITTALLGMLTGFWVQRPPEEVSNRKKVNYMVVAGVLLLVVGWLWSYTFPINKKLWTSTFVCVVASYSILLFALFYWIIDCKGYTRWAFFFRVIGLNSITIYLAQRIIPFNAVNTFFLGGLAEKLPNTLAEVVLRSGYVAVCWLFLYFLYKKKVFLKV